MTITNVIIKTPDRKLDWGVNDVMPGSDGLRIWWFLKKAVSWDLTLGRASPAGGGGLTVGDVGIVSIVKIVCVSLSSCRKLKVKKLINVSYLYNGESWVFRIFLHLYILHVIFRTLVAVWGRGRCRRCILQLPPSRQGKLSPVWFKQT